MYVLLYEQEQADVGELDINGSGGLHRKQNSTRHCFLFYQLICSSRTELSITEDSY